MRKKNLALIVLALMLILPACQREGGKSVQAQWEYPETRKVDQIDNYFGTKVEDPYRWLENLNDPEVKKWIEEQNKLSFSYLENIPFREKMRQRVTEIYNYPRCSSPFRARSQLFCRYLKDAHTVVYQHDVAGKLVRKIDLPALGPAMDFSAKKEDKILFYTFTSFTFPPVIYKYDIANGKSEIFRKTEIDFNPENYVSKQVFYQSKDGTSTRRGWPLPEHPTAVCW